MAGCCGKCGKKKVVAVIPVHGRLPLLKHTIQRLLKKNDVDQVVCVGDSHEDRKLCESVGAHWVHFKNRPLGMKWNTGFEEAKQFNPDACLFVGSSDWVSDNWLQVMTLHLDKYDLIGTPGCYFLHVGNLNMKLCHWPGYIGQRSGESIGMGRLISANVLENIRWNPFDSSLDRSLDHSMVQKITLVSGKSHLVNTSIAKSVSISTDRWLNKHRFHDHYSGKLPSQIIHNPEEWIEKNFPEANLIFNYENGHIKTPQTESN